MLLLTFCISAIVFLVSGLVLGDSYSPGQEVLLEDEQDDAFANSLSRKQMVIAVVNTLSLLVLAGSVTYGAAMYAKGLI